MDPEVDSDEFKRRLRLIDKKLDESRFVMNVRRPDYFPRSYRGLRYRLRSTRYRLKRFLSE